MKNLERNGNFKKIRAMDRAVSVVNFDDAQERYFGEALEKHLPDAPENELIEAQKVAVRLYESRIASMQRCVAFFVLFHSMASRIRDFWAYASFGLLDYDMSKTHSIMRIATTASPVSGAEVRDRAKAIRLKRRIEWAENVLAKAAKRWLVRLRNTQIEHGRKVMTKKSSMMKNAGSDSAWARGDRPAAFVAVMTAASVLHEFQPSSVMTAQSSSKSAPGSKSRTNSPSARSRSPRTRFQAEAKTRSPTTSG